MPPAVLTDGFREAVKDSREMEAMWSLGTSVGVHACTCTHMHPSTDLMHTHIPTHLSHTPFYPSLSHTHPSTHLTCAHTPLYPFHAPTHTPLYPSHACTHIPLCPSLTHTPLYPSYAHLHTHTYTPTHLCSSHNPPVHKAQPRPVSLFHVLGFSQRLYPL